MIVERDGQICVSGAMNLQTAVALLEQGQALMGHSDRELNLRDVSGVDSSALAVVLAWMRAARAGGGRVTVVEPPQAFTSLAHLYGVDEILFPPVDTVAKTS